MWGQGLNPVWNVKGRARSAWCRAVLVSLMSLAPLPSLLAWDGVLEWDRNPAGEQVTGYRVYLSTGTQLGETTQNRFPLPGRAGVECYQVSAVNAAGESEKSEEVCGPIPSIPKGVKVTVTVTVEVP